VTEEVWHATPNCLREGAGSTITALDLARALPKFFIGFGPVETVLSAKGSHLQATWMIFDG
jgi:hypothetical protein